MASHGSNEDRSWKRQKGQQSRECQNDRADTGPDTAKAKSPDQIIRHERRQGKIVSPFQLTTNKISDHIGLMVYRIFGTGGGVFLS